MSLLDNAGEKTVETIDKVTIPELEAAGKRLIDYLIQRLDEFVQKYAKAIGLTK